MDGHRRWWAPSIWARAVLARDMSKSALSRHRAKQGASVMSCIRQVGRNLLTRRVGGRGRGWARDAADKRHTLRSQG